MFRIRSRYDGQDRRADDAHVARQHDDVRAGAGQDLGQRVVIATRDERRVDPLLRRPVERRARPVGEDEHDVAAELAADGRRLERPQVGTGAGDADRDARPVRSAARPVGHPTVSRDALDIARSADRGRLDHLADDHRRDRRGRSSARDGRRDGDGRHDRDHPEAAVERRSQLGVVEAAERPEQAHHRRHPPACRVHAGGKAVGQGTRHVPGQAAAGDVGEPVQVVAGGDQGRTSGEDRPGVDGRRRQQHLAERRHRPRAAPPPGARRSSRVTERPAQAGLVGLGEVEVPLRRPGRGPASSRWRAGRSTPSPGSRPRPGPPTRR